MAKGAIDHHRMMDLCSLKKRPTRKDTMTNGCKTMAMQRWTSLSESGLMMDSFRSGMATVGAKVVKECCMRL